MFRKPTVWIALFAVPLLYALARCTPQPWPLVLSGVLHWTLACAVLVGTRSGNDAPDIGLRHRLRGFIVFVVVIAAYCGGLIWCFGSETLARWQYAQMPLGRWGVIVTAISAGFCEEVTYRGYMMTGLKQAGHPVWLAMVLSSLSFVFFHGVPPVPFIVAFFVVSMIWAAIYHKTSILWVTIYFHAVWDATVLLVPLGTDPH